MMQDANANAEQGWPDLPALVLTAFHLPAAAEGLARRAERVEVDLSWKCDCDSQAPLTPHMHAGLLLVSTFPSTATDL